MEHELPKTITKTLYICHRQYDWEKEPAIDVLTYDPRKSDNSSGAYIVVGTEEITLNVPEADTTMLRIEALEKKAEAIKHDAHVKVAQIQDRIQSLRALEHG